MEVFVEREGMPSVSASENGGAADIVEQVETDGVVVEPDEEGLLGHANRLFELGCTALRSQQYDEACDCIGKALEIRVQHYGELAIECAPTLYKYGCALLYKIQSESDALGQTDAAREKAEALSTEAVVKTVDGDDDLTDDETEAEDFEEDGDGAASGVGGANEDELDEGMSDLQLAWENLELARHIYQTQAQRSLEEVDVIAALADVSLEKEDFKSCYDDYTSALEILEKLVEPDDRRLAELCFKLCLALQLNNKAKDAMEYCKRAVSVCEARLERLKNQTSKKPAEEPASAEENKITAEITEIEELLVDLREKVLELQEMTDAPSLMEALQAVNPSAAASVKQVLSAVATSMSRTGEPSKAIGSSPASSSTGFDESAMCGSSTCVTDLGVVGRGVKRAAPIPLPAGQTGSKRRTLEDLMNGGSSAGHTESGSSSRVTIAGEALENGVASPQVSAGVSSNTTIG